MKLDIGGGNCPAESTDCKPLFPGPFTIVDKFYQLEGGIVADAWDIPLDKESVDYIYTSHMLEHLSAKNGQLALQEWYRILKPEGILEIKVPSLAYCIREWLNAPEKERWGFNLDRIFGAQNYEGDTHLTGFDINRLSCWLQNAKFTIKTIEEIYCNKHQQNEIHAIAERNL